MNKTIGLPTSETSGKDFFRELCRTVASFVWTAMLASCTTVALTKLHGSDSLTIFFGTWFLIWVILRIIRHFAARNKECITPVSTNTIQSAFVFITDGILGCFMLGRAMSTDGDSSYPITLIWLGVLWLVLLLVEIFAAIWARYTEAKQAQSALMELCMRMADENAEYITMVGQCEDGTQETFCWIRADHGPTEDPEN